MKITSMVSAAKIMLALLWISSLAVQAAEIKVLSAAGMKSVVEDLGAKYEQTSGHKLVLKFVGGPAVQEAIAAGEVYDVAISQPAQIDRLLKDGKLIADSRADIARSGMGVGVRKGSAKPDIVTEPNPFLLPQGLNQSCLTRCRKTRRRTTLIAAWSLRNRQTWI